MGLLFWRKKKPTSQSKAEEKDSVDSNGASSRQIPVILPRRDPAVFEFGSASGVSMTGVCNVGEADEISACVWRIQDKAQDGKQEDQKPRYHIEF
ncbi:g82 [Coccomyxa elongata]